MTRRPRIVLLCLLAGTALADDPWRTVRHEADGLVLEARPITGSDFEELRVRVRVAASPSDLADAVWLWRPDGVEARMVEKRVVLSECSTERVVYQVLRPPLVSKRQSLMRFSRKESDHGRSVRVSFVSLEGPLPEQLDAVRVAMVRGDWNFQADAPRDTWLEYRCVSDPGGGLPAWLAAGVQQDLALSLVREAMRLARTSGQRASVGL